MSLEEEIELLLADGWKEGKLITHLDKHDRVFYKRFPGEPRCWLNRDKHMQGCLKLWDFRRYSGDAGYSYEFCLQGEPEGFGYGVSISVSTDKFENLSDRIETAFIMWRAVNS